MRHVGDIGFPVDWGNLPDENDQPGAETAEDIAERILHGCTYPDCGDCSKCQEGQ